MISPERKKELQKLVEKYQQGKATPREKEFIEQYYQYFDTEERITASMNIEEKAILEKRLFEKIAVSIKDEPQKVVSIYRRPFFRVSAVAASLLLVVGLGVCFLLLNKTKKPAGIVNTSVKDVEAPKNTRAVITLSDGRTVAIDSITSGMLAQQSDVTVTKTADGKIVYAGNTDKVVYNTLTNPRGSKVIDMMLADGSHVWLNAGSSVTYPVAFVSKERKIEITGEAYFEVAHDATKPFYVSKGDMRVQVFGTHFNVNAYDGGKDIKVTLLEGAVKVSSGRHSERVLKPGQQAQVATGADVARSPMVVRNVDVKTIMAWKNGLFNFQNRPLDEVMQQLSTWYDIDVVFDNGIPGITVMGEMGRDLNLSEVMEILSNLNVRYKLEGKKLTVLGN